MLSLLIDQAIGNRSMKVLILGTSNSILKNGWVAGLRHALPGTSIENRSVGASPGVQFALVAQIDYSKYDVVFFDSIPNDQEFSSLNVLDAAGKSRLWEAVLFDLCSIISSQTCLIVMGFCHRNFLSSACSVYSSRECLAQRLGVQFIDVRGILNRMMAAGAGSPGDLYEEHPAHVREPLAFTIGCHVGSVLRMRPTLLTKSIVASPLPDHFITLWAEDMGQPTQLYSNSLLELRTTELREGYELLLQQGVHCLGFSLDIARTHCCLQLLDPGRESAVDYLCYHPIREDSVVKVFLPVLCSGIVRSLRVAADPGPSAFQTLFSGKVRDPAQPIQLALSAVSFWKGAGEVSTNPPRRSNTDILQINREISAKMETGMECLSGAARGSGC